MRALGLLALGWALLALPVQAETNAAPALYGINEIVLQPIELPSSEAVTRCGLLRTSLEKFWQNALTGANLPLASSKTNAAAVPARLQLLLRVQTEQTPLGCHSYVQLTAADRYAMRLAPVAERRNLNVLYWQQGFLINSETAQHLRQVSDALSRLVDNFARDYRLAQPESALNRAAEEERRVQRERQNNLQQIMEQFGGTAGGPNSGPVKPPNEKLLEQINRAVNGTSTGSANNAPAAPAAIAPVPNSVTPVTPKPITPPTIAPVAPVTSPAVPR